MDYEDDPQKRRRHLSYLLNQLGEGKISENKYRVELEENYDILSPDQKIEHDNWKAESVKKAKAAKEKVLFENQKKEKERAESINTILLIAVAILGIFIFIWSKTKK